MAKQGGDVFFVLILGLILCYIAGGFMVLPMANDLGGGCRGENSSFVEAAQHLRKRDSGKTLAGLMAGQYNHNLVNLDLSTEKSARGAG